MSFISKLGDAEYSVFVSQVFCLAVPLLRWPQSYFHCRREYHEETGGWSLDSTCGHTHAST